MAADADPASSSETDDKLPTSLPLMADFCASDNGDASTGSPLREGQAYDPAGLNNNTATPPSPATDPLPSPQSPTRSKPTLLGLPAELRLFIYHHVFAALGPFTPEADPTALEPTSLFQLCRLIRSEASAEWDAWVREPDNFAEDLRFLDDECREDQRLLMWLQCWRDSMVRHLRSRADVREMLRRERLNNVDGDYGDDDYDYYLLEEVRNHSWPRVKGDRRSYFRRLEELRGDRG